MLNTEFRRLAVFDFDHTIIDETVDLTVRDLVEPTKIPSDVKALYKQTGFIPYMQAVFQILHNNGINKNDIILAVARVEEVKGMIQLIKKLHEMKFDIIIMSDSNELFIKNWCLVHGVRQYIKEIFSNPAYFNNNGKLILRPYHHQTECSLSTENLCKGMILDDYIESQKKNYNVVYGTVFYIGDGRNDVCPALRLCRWDYACPRMGYRMDLELDKIINNTPDKCSNQRLDAQLIRWSDGIDLFAGIRQVVRTDAIQDVVAARTSHKRKQVAFTKLREVVFDAIAANVKLTEPLPEDDTKDTEINSN